MNIKNIAQHIIRTMYLSLVIGFASYSSADQYTATEYSTPYSKDVASLEYYSYQEPAYQSEETSSDFSFKEKNKTNEDRIGSLFYKTINDPDKVRNQVAGTAILYGLDGVGLGDTVREGIYFIKKNTRYSFGDCGNVQLKTGKITAGSCLSDGGSVELNSSYNFNSVQLQFKWSL